MRVEDPNGDLMWAPNDFGKYSLDKMQAVADILSNMMSELAITMKLDSESLKNTYTKEEILDLMKAYMLKTDFEEMAGQAVQDKTDLYIKALQDAGAIVTTDVTGAISGEVSEIKRVVDYLTKLCFDSTFASTAGWATEPTFEVLPPRLDNIDSQIIDISGRVDAVIRDVYVNAHTREGFKFATTDQLGTVSNTATQAKSVADQAKQDVSDLSSDMTTLSGNVTSLSGNVSSLSGQVGGLESSIGDTSTVDASVSSADLVGVINNLVNLIGGLSTQIQSLEDRIAQLETNP